MSGIWDWACCVYCGSRFFYFVSHKNNGGVFLYFGVVQIWRIPQVMSGQRMTWLSFKLPVLMQSGQISNGFTATGFWWWFVSMGLTSRFDSIWRICLLWTFWSSSFWVSSCTMVGFSWWQTGRVSSFLSFAMGVCLVCLPRKSDEALQLISCA